MRKERFPGDLLDRYQLLQTVLCDRRFNLAAAQVCAALLRRYNEKSGCVWPSVACIEDDTGLSRRQVFRALELLEATHLFDVERTPRKPSTYTPNWDAIDVPTLRDADIPY
jgi:hypothetical protein